MNASTSTRLVALAFAAAVTAYGGAQAGQVLQVPDSATRAYAERYRCVPVNLDGTLYRCDSVGEETVLVPVAAMQVGSDGGSR